MGRIKINGSIVFIFFALAAAIAVGGKSNSGGLSGVMRRLLLTEDEPVDTNAVGSSSFALMPNYTLINPGSNQTRLAVGWTTNFGHAAVNLECYWCTSLVNRVWTPFPPHEISSGETNYVFTDVFVTNCPSRFYALHADVLSVKLNCVNGASDSGQTIWFSSGATLFDVDVDRTSRPDELPPYDSAYAADPFCNCEGVTYDPVNKTVSLEDRGVYSLPDGSLIASLRPTLSFGTPHTYTGPAYPLDSEWLWDGWHKGMYMRGCDCHPELTIDPEGDYASRGISNRLDVVGNVGYGYIYAGSNTVWEECCYHDPYPEHYGREDELSSSDDEFDDCECGDGESLDGPSLGSIRFRLSLGMPRADMVSGFLYFDRDSPFTPAVSDFSVMKRSDALVSDETDQDTGVRRIVCSDAGGRTLVVSNTVSGVLITVERTASGTRLCSWDISASAGTLRFRKLSLADNVILDRSYSLCNGSFVETDNVSGLSREKHESADETEEIETMGGKVVRHVVVRSEEIGVGESAVRREVERRELVGLNTWSHSFAAYWNDAHDVRRHGTLRYVYGDDRDWRYFDYDGYGRMTLRIEQRNGSAAPGVAAYSVSDLPSSDCTVTVFGYQPSPGDSDDACDFRKWRTETRYVKDGGTVTLVARTWRRFTRSSVGSYPSIVVTTERGYSSTASAGDLGNAVSSVTYFADDSPDVPYVLRGQVAEEMREDGTRVVYERTPVGDSVRTVERRLYDGHEAKTRGITLVDAYGNTLYEATALTADGTEFDARWYDYDDLHRLRRVRYPDGSFTTNAYSCCRLLWSIDRNGAKSVRVAETGTDRLHYAIDDEYLEDLPHADPATGGIHRIMHRYMDGLGRLTNTVVTATGTGDAPRRTDSVDYPEGVSGTRVSVSSRGLVTRERMTSSASKECNYNDVYVSFDALAAVKSEYRESFRGGSQISGTVTDDGSESVQSDEYCHSDGCRGEVETAFPIDGDLYEKSRTSYDFLGRAEERASPFGVTRILYAEGREHGELDCWTGVVVTNVYNASGELVGNVSRGTVSLSETDYEFSGGVLWKVERELVTYETETNRDSVVKTRLTGLSDSLRSETLRYEFGVEVEYSYSSFDPETKVLTETTVSPLSGTNVVESMFGKTIHASSAGEEIWNYFDGFGRVVYTEKSVAGIAERSPCSWKCYDVNGDLVSEGEYTNATDSVVTREYSYDVFGNVSRRVDASGAVVTNVYDAEGHVLLRGGDAYPVRYSYGHEGRTKSLSTTRDGTVMDTTVWEYETATGSVTNKIYADGMSEGYAYTPDNKLCSVTNPDGGSFTNVYDADRFLTAVDSSDPSCRYGFANDARGRTVVASNASWSSSFVYDYRGNIAQESTRVTGAERTLVRGFDIYGRLSHIALSGCQDNAVGYDSRGRVAALSNAEFRVDYRYAGDAIDAGYDIVFTNGVVFSRSLVRNPFAPDEVLVVTNAAAGDPSVIGYAYDAMHRPVSRNADSITYNLRGEVVSAIVGGESESHAYDFIGNEFASNCLNQPTEGPWGSTLAYDSCGRLITHFADASMPTLVLTYDAMSRLVTASAVESEITLVQSNSYDHIGRRVLKCAPDGVHRYYYDGWTPRLETIVSNGAETVIEYVWGKDISGSLGGAAGIGGLLYTKINGAIYVPQYDAYGNIIRYCDINGTTVAEYVYDAFGRTITATGPLSDVFAFRFSTKYYDRETGFYYYGRRCYSPALRRWITRDPIGEDGGLNLYEFCKGNAVCGYDIRGEFGVRMFSSALVEKWYGVKYEERTVNSVDDIYVIDDFESEEGAHGYFLIPDKSYLRFSGCDLEFGLWIWLKSNLVENGSATVDYWYRPHFNTDDRMEGGNAKTSDGSPFVRGAVLSHEKGHATSFLKVAMPKFRRAIKKYSDKAARDLTPAERNDVWMMLDESRKEAIDDSCVRANTATIDWFRLNGLKLKIYH